jgi:hypothetical protein
MEKILYTHIEKCGGTWIREVFKKGGWRVTVDGRPWCDGDRGELTVNQNMLVDPNDWDEHLIVIRDPWERLLSYYNYSTVDAWDQVGEMTTRFPRFRMFVETLPLDKDYETYHRHSKYPKYFPRNIMPYRSMRYTLDLLNNPGINMRGAGCVFDIKSTELVDWLENKLEIDVKNIKPINVSLDKMKKWGVEDQYKKRINSVEKSGILQYGVLNDDLQLWDEFNNRNDTG